MTNSDSGAGSLRKISQNNNKQKKCMKKEEIKIEQNSKMKI